MSAAREVVVCRTGTANLASVFAGLRRAGGAPRMAESPADIEDAGHVMLPGVGSFGAAMESLRESGMVAPLRARFAAGRPTMAICVGLQLLCRTSEESPGAQGLAVIDADIARFPSDVRVPQFGWNRVVPNTDCRLIAEGHAYFANSFRLTDRVTGWAVAIADHGGTYIAAMEKGALLACQFHPELSGAYGHALLARWIALPC